MVARRRLKSQLGYKRQEEAREGGGVTSQVGGAVGVGQSGPRASTLEPAEVAGALGPSRGPLDHHELGHGAVFQQRPRQGHAGAVDDPHAEGAHAATCNTTGGKNYLHSVLEEQGRCLCGEKSTFTGSALCQRERVDLRLTRET